MISRLADYDFVAGDIANVVIDGGVMPLRNGVSATTGVDRKKILRGEDICLLAEGAPERARCMNGLTWNSYGRPLVYNGYLYGSAVSADTFSFSRRITASQLASIWYNYRKVVWADHNPVFLTGYPSNEYGMAQRAEIFDGVHQPRPVETTDLGAVDPSSGDSLRSDIIWSAQSDATLFGDMKLLTIPYYHYDPGGTFYNANVYSNITSDNLTPPGDVVDGAVANEGFFAAYGYSLRSYGDSDPDRPGAYTYWIRPPSGMELFRVPDKYLSNVRCFMEFEFTYNDLTGSGNVQIDYRFFRETGTVTHQNGWFVCTLGTSDVDAVIADVVARTGRQFPTTSDLISLSGPSRMYYMDYIRGYVYVIGTLGDHTKWW